MVDDCFEQTRNVTGVDKQRQLAEAMYEARSKAKLTYLTGAAVVMYGLPVVSQTVPVVGEEKENILTIQSPEKTPSQEPINPKSPKLAAQVLSSQRQQPETLKTPSTKTPPRVAKTPRKT
uniref:Uncharacterized protein n=2 Tax=Caenorhabditis japonica TaxID=281687 RepID=A0A8R1I6M2_CAEJA